MKKQSTGRETCQSTAIHNPSPPVFVLLLNAACNGEKQQIANLVIGLTLEFNPQSTTRVHHYITEAVSVMVLNTTFNNISIKSWQSVLLQDSQRVVIGTDCIDSYKSNYHTITITMRIIAEAICLIGNMFKKQGQQFYIEFLY
jgi:hypothetical protein